MARKTPPAESEGPVRYFKEQFDDEEVLLVFRKHPVVMRKGLILASIGLLLPMLYILALTFIYANNPENFFVTFFTCSLLALTAFIYLVFLKTPKPPKITHERTDHGSPGAPWIPALRMRFHAVSPQ